MTLNGVPAGGLSLKQAHRKLRVLAGPGTGAVSLRGGGGRAVSELLALRAGA